jgi:hypothetical protein
MDCVRTGSGFYLYYRHGDGGYQKVLLPVDKYCMSRTQVREATPGNATQFTYNVPVAVAVAPPAFFDNKCPRDFVESDLQGLIFSPDASATDYSLCVWTTQTPCGGTMRDPWRDPKPAVSLGGVSFQTCNLLPLTINVVQSPTT